MNNQNQTPRTQTGSNVRTDEQQPKTGTKENKTGSTSGNQSGTR